MLTKIASAIALASFVTIAPNAIACSAIAYSPSTGTSSEAHGFDTVSDAEAGAIARCGQSDCYVVQSTVSGCIAFARGTGRIAWSGAHHSPQHAINEAVALCRAWDCAWKVYACN